MNIFARRNGAEGGTLVVTLVLCCILAFSVMGYLSVVEQQGLLGRRSQAWNIAMTIAEAGVEEGLQHLNKNYNNLASDGWSLSGSLYVRTNALPDGNAYSVAIQNGSQPVIVSKSYVASLQTFAQAGQPAIFAAVGPAPTTPTVLSRGVRVRCHRAGYATKAMAARRTIDMNGNNILTDSFDSEDPTRSLNGRYDPSRAGDNGDVASNDTIMNSVSVGNANIYGRVATGPGGTVSVGSQGGVGSHAYQTLYPGSMQPDWVTHDSNFTFPDTKIPYNSGMAPQSGWVAESTIVVVTNPVSTAQEPPSGTPGVKIDITGTTVTSTRPDPVPYGTITNTSVITSTTYPAGVPETEVRRNPLGTVTTSTYPDPAPASVTTSIVTETTDYFPTVPYLTVQPNTQSVTTKYAPEPGSYIGEVTQNGKFYTYRKIVNYTWTHEVYTYEKYSYTYTLTTYTVPTGYQYNYNVYTEQVVWQTNYYDNILYSGSYYMGTLSGKTIVLGKALLVSANGISMSGSDVLKIKQGGSLTNWVGGTSVSIGGNGVLNETGLAKNYVCLCEESVTTVAIGGNGEFTGVFIAPNGNMQLNGGGNSRMDFVGAVMVNKVKLNGHYQFHYDEALGRLPASGRYLISAWDEVPVQNGASGF